MTSSSLAWLCCWALLVERSPLTSWPCSDWTSLQPGLMCDVKKVALHPAPDPVCPKLFQNHTSLHRCFMQTRVYFSLGKTLHLLTLVRVARLSHGRQETGHRHFPTRIFFLKTNKQTRHQHKQTPTPRKWFNTTTQTAMLLVFTLKECRCTLSVPLKYKSLHCDRLHLALNWPDSFSDRFLAFPC